jgi:hypothetical protein
MRTIEPSPPRNSVVACWSTYSDPSGPNAMSVTCVSPAAYTLFEPSGVTR